jgi:hypothetical protein
MNIPLMAGSGFAVFCIYMLQHSIRSYKKAIESQDWPSVTGTLVLVKLWGTRNINGIMTDSERLDMQYEYKVNGVRYTGETVAFYTLMYPETLNYAKSHPCKSDISVYYNPINPNDSVLIPGLRKDKPYSDLIIATLGVMVGVSVAFSGWMGWLG